MHPDRVGPYLIEKKIGAGGMGNVYLGRQETSGQLAAVKVLPSSLAREEGFVLRFNREVEALGKLKHPNIVAFYDSGVDDETYYYAMEYVDGETLTQRIRREKRIPWRETVEFAIQVCGALKSAHDAGVIHRDLKPSNLLIDRAGNMKLTDFGVAQVFAASKLTVTGGVIGTAEYMSPEQSQGQRASKRSDLYSLGAVMYVMLTGRPPFTGNSTMEIMHKQRFGRFDRPKLYVPEIPSWLDDLVAQLLEKEPEKRPPDAYVLSRRLQEILAKVELSTKDGSDTMVQSHVTISDTTPAVLLGEPAVGATLMRDLVRGEIERQQTHTGVHAALNNTWVLVTLLVLVVGVAIWAMPRPGAIPASHAEADADTQIRSETENWLAEVPRRRGRLPKIHSEPVRILDQIRRDWERGDYDAAHRQLAALTVLLQDDPEAAELKPTIERWQAALEDVRKPLVDLRRSYIETQLDLARQQQTGEAAQVRRMLDNLIALYGEDESVADLIDTARRLQESWKHDGK